MASEGAYEAVDLATVLECSGAAVHKLHITVEDGVYTIACMELDLIHPHTGQPFPCRVVLQADDARAVGRLLIDCANDIEPPHDV